MFDPVSYHVAETLNDGSKVEIRAQRPEDREALLVAVRRASTESLYHRFFVVKRNFRAGRAFLPRHRLRQPVALVAEAIENGGPVIVGGCRYVVVEPGRAEVAFSVIDAYQKKGLGTALMRCLAAIGREAGLTELVADVLSENVPMMKVFKRSGLAMTAKREGTVFYVSLRYEGAEPEARLERPSRPADQGRFERGVAGRTVDNSAIQRDPHLHILGRIAGRSARSRPHRDDVGNKRFGTLDTRPAAHSSDRPWQLAASVPIARRKVRKRSIDPSARLGQWPLFAQLRHPLSAQISA